MNFVESLWFPMLAGALLGVAAWIGVPLGTAEAVRIPLFAAAALLLTDATTGWRLRQRMQLFGKLWPRVEPELYAMRLALPRYALLLALSIAAIVMLASFGLQLWQVWPGFLAVMSYLALFFTQMVTAIRRHRQ